GLGGNGTATVTLTGTQAQINATLGAGLTYLGGLNYNGLDALTMTTTDAGGLSDTDVVRIDVLSAQQQAVLLVDLIADLTAGGTPRPGLGAAARAVCAPGGKASSSDRRPSPTMESHDVLTSSAPQLRCSSGQQPSPADPPVNPGAARRPPLPQLHRPRPRHAG